MTKAEIKERLSIMLHFTEGKARQIGNNMCGEIQSDTYDLGQIHAYEVIAEKLARLMDEI